MWSKNGRGREMTREEAITKINRLRNEYNDQYIDYCGTNEAVNMAIEALKAEPVRHGRWINHLCEDGATDGIFCSQCDYEIDRDSRPNYCPNCGAKMQEVEDGGNP